LEIFIPKLIGLITQYEQEHRSDWHPMG
jgi:hypothetical protein